MIKLFRIEFKKILTYKTFWIIIGLYFLFLVLGIIMAQYILNNIVNDINKHSPIPLPHVTLYFFPEVWQNVTFFASIRYVLIFPAIIIMILITNEFTNKTIRQNIVTGMSKQEFLISKLQFIFLLSIVITIILTVFIIILGISNSDEQQMKLMWHGIVFIPVFFLQVTVFMIFAFFCGFLLRNTGLAIALFTLYALIIEPVVYFILKIPYLQPNHISQYLPVNTVIRLVEYPSISMLHKVMNLTLQEGVNLVHCLIAILYGVVMIGVVSLVMHRKDL
jgi:ABC-2 type transport system permease protein